MKKLVIVFSTIAFASLTVTSCLKDTKFDNHEYGIKDPAGSPDGVLLQEGGTKLVNRAVDLLATSQSARMFEVNLASEKPASQDIHVNFVNDTSLVRAYNTANGTSLVNLNSSQYSFTTKAVIRAGKSVDTFKLTLPNASLLNPNLSYGFAFTISSVDETGITIAQNLKTIYIQLNLKNKYDGKYRVTGTFADLLNPAFVSVLPNDVQLVTTGPNSVSVQRVINGVLQPGYLFSTGTSGSYYGNWGAVFNFDASDNLTTVTNSFGQGAGNRFGVIDPTGTAEGKNKFFTADHSIKAKYTMNQPNITTVRSRYDETYTYTGPR